MLHRGRGRGLPEHGLTGPQRRADQRADRPRDPGAGSSRRRAPARLPAEPAGPRAARGVDEPDRRRRSGTSATPSSPGRSRPWWWSRWPTGYNVVLGHVHGAPGRGDPLTSVLETRHTDAIVLLGDLQVQPRLVADLRSSSVPVVALLAGTSLDRVPHRGHRRPGRHPGRARATWSPSGTGGSRSVSAELPVDYRVREDAYADFMRDRFGASRPATWSGARTPWPGGDAALRRLLELPEPPIGRGHLDRPGGRRRPARRPQPRRDRAPAAVGGGATTTS